MNGEDLCAEALLTAFEADFMAQQSKTMSKMDSTKNRSLLLSEFNPIIRNMIKQYEMRLQEVRKTYDDLIISLRPADFLPNSQSKPPQPPDYSALKIEYQFKLASRAEQELRSEIQALREENHQLKGLLEALLGVDTK